MSKPQVPAPGGRRKKKQSGADLFRGADDEVDEYTQSTWTSSTTIKTAPTHSNEDHKSKHRDKNKAKDTNSPLPTPQKPNTELLYRQLNNRSKKRNTKQRQQHVKSSSAIGSLRNKWFRNSAASKKEAAAAGKAVTKKNRSKSGGRQKNKNIIIKVSKTNKIDATKLNNRSRKHSKHKKRNKKHVHKHPNVVFDIESEQQILGDILIHTSSWNHLISRDEATHHAIAKQKPTNHQAVVGWKQIYSVLDRETICFWDNPKRDTNTNTHDEDDRKINDRHSAHITIYLSEILTLSKSIRSIDGEKYIIELNVCGNKCLLSFANIEQREYWHSLLSDYHLNYFVWRSTPLDESHRRSQNVIAGVYKLLKSQKQSVNTIATDASMDAVNMDTLNILYIEEILQKISDLNITAIIDMVPPECRFMSGRLIRVIMSIKFFFMSVLKSLSGADIPLPSRELLMRYLDEIAEIVWAETSRQVLDFYCDKCYRIMFHLSFAFTSNARDEIMKLNEYIEFKKKREVITQNAEADAFEDERKIAEMKFEYESLQRSWKMHRDRLQEYVMAYRDAVAKLKHSYHQRDSLCKKIETLQKEKKQMNESMRIQSKTYNRTIAEAQKLTQKFAILSQQMQNQIIANTATMNGTQYPRTQPPVIKAQPHIKKAKKSSKNNSNNTSSEIQQISQQMTDLFNALNVDNLNSNANDTNKYTWI